MMNCFYYVLLTLWSFVLACSTDCQHRFRTINVYETVSKVNVSCYSGKVDCTLLYSKPGQGCDIETVEFVTVNAGTIRSVTYNFEVGGAICSNQQIDVSYLRDTTLVHWPRATDAGQKFGQAFWNPLGAYQTYKIGCSTLSTPASIVLKSSSLSSPSSFELSPYSFLHVNSIIIDKLLDEWATITSNASIVVSYVNFNGHHEKYYVWQPISIEPVFVHVPKNYHLAYQEYICDTAELLPAKIGLSIKTGSIATSECSPVPIDQNYGFLFHYRESCVVKITPVQDTVCVSASLYGSQTEDYMTKDMALSSKKFASTFLSSNVDSFAILISESGNTCQSYSEYGQDDIRFTSVQDNLTDLIFYGRSPYNVQYTGLIECSDLVYLSLDGAYQQNIASYGLNSVELWADYFKSIGCESLPPMPINPPDPLPITPSSTLPINQPASWPAPMKPLTPIPSAASSCIYFSLTFTFFGLVCNSPF